jgi:tetratricopeptide (TPR) repeat protein
VATNPRIDDLRRRLEKEPNSRLFAQLAEELRKDGDFEEAIRIARAGLARHPAYPSARMTLGRALFDTGDMAAARQELESVLEGAPDNILASRLLAECLEALGDVHGALARYRATLALSPGDKQITAHVRDLEGKAQPITRPGVSPAASPSESPAAAVVPIPLATVDEPMVLEVSQERMAPAPAPSPAPAPAAAPAAAPVPVAEAAAEFELETAYEAPGTQWQGTRAEEPAMEDTGAASASEAVPDASSPAATPEPAAVAFTTPPVADEVGERTLADVPSPMLEAQAPVPEANYEGPFDVAPEEPEPAGPQVAEPQPAAPEPAVAEVMPPLPEPVAVAAPPAPVPPEPASAASTPPPLEPTSSAELLEPEPVAPPAPATPTPPAADRDDAELVSPTLAELYFNQGFPEKAAEVYRRILEREPGNERARVRVQELQQAGPAAVAAAPAGESDQARAERRAALERTIERLESLRAALQKGAR